MSSDILACLELDKKLLLNKVIVAKEMLGCDSTFLTCCVLGHCVKKKEAVLVILTHNSFTHYHNIGLKMNYNLQKSVDCGLIQFYNAGKDLVDNLLTDELTSQEFLLRLENKIHFMQKNNSIVNVIFEGVSHLFDLQFTLKEVNSMCKVIIDIMRKSGNSFILFHCNVANETDVTNVLANMLSHKSDTLIEVESLTSGWSADVAGRITVRHPRQKFGEHLFALEQKSNQYLFKLFDRGVKLFAPGTV